MSYQASESRYASMQYRRCGKSGLELPAISLGLWHNFGGVDVFETAAPCCCAPSTSGSPTSTWPTTTARRRVRPRRHCGRVLRTDLAGHRDELVLSTKAGYGMWPGPYGDWGSRKYLVASLDQSLRRMGVDYVDIFYHHRPDPKTPLEETMGALDYIVRSGRRSTSASRATSRSRTREAVRILRALGTPCLIHQPSYSMFNRWIEGGLLEVLAAGGCRLHLLLAARAGPADRPLPGRHPAGLARRQAARLPEAEGRRRGGAREGAAPQRPGARRAGRRWRRWPSPGCCVTRA